MPRTLTTYAVHRPDEEAAAATDLALDLLASALADLLIAEARAEVASELGVSPASIDREKGKADLERVSMPQLPGWER